MGDVDETLDPMELKDGVVEALEHTRRRFAIGVQWHPEGTWRDDPYSQKLFAAFVQAARGTR